MSTPTSSAASNEVSPVPVPEDNSGNNKISSNERISKFNTWVGIMTSIVSLLAASIAVGAQWANMESKISSINSTVAELNKKLDENETIIRNVDEKVQGMDKRIGKIEASFDVFLRMKK